LLRPSLGTTTELLLIARKATLIIGRKPRALSLGSESPAPDIVESRVAGSVRPP